MLRTRFAPSPTGDLHVGGVRTALFCWLAAKQASGRFILRIEDTDQERSTEASSQVILEAMAWLGLDFDEGPFYQSLRFDRYREVVQQLLDTGHAYRCDCSKARLEQLREGQMERKEKPKYDLHCLHRQHEIKPELAHVVRFKCPQSPDLKISWDDLVRGTIEFAIEELDDFILLRSDGTPTYQLGVVVDDYDMAMTLVLRGDDHINNTPKQLLLFQALNAKPPVYGHIPMILGADGKRLSKRHGAASVFRFREEGFLKQALINYLVRLGWSHQDQEIFSIEELIEKFDMHHIQKSPAVFNFEKLQWLNHHYIKTLPFGEMQEEIMWHLNRSGLSLEGGPNLEQVVAALRERAPTLTELVDMLHYFYAEFEHYEPKSAAKHLTQEALPVLEWLENRLTALEDWQVVTIHQVIEGAAAALSLGLGKVGMPFRVAIAGSGTSPAIDLTAYLIGKARVIARLKRAIKSIQSA